MHERERKTGKDAEKTTSLALEIAGSSDDSLVSRGTIVQLTENFRFVFLKIKM